MKGRNPFKDVRVRRAVQLAIDTDLIVRQVLRGEGTVTGSFVSPLVDGHLPEFEKRPKADAASARALLKEAGYETGFAVQMDCVNVAWRASVCQAAASMLEKVGIRASLATSPSSVFFPKLSQGTGFLVEFGWSANPDPWGTLQSLVRTNDGLAAGAFNAGRYSNPKLDSLLDQALAVFRSRRNGALSFVGTSVIDQPGASADGIWWVRSGIAVFTYRFRG